jgi:hypothetical protein
MAGSEAPKVVMPVANELKTEHQVVIARREERVDYLIELLKEHSPTGEAVDVVKAKFKEKFSERLTGPTLGAARRRMGVRTRYSSAAGTRNTKLPSLDAMGIPMKESLRIYQDYQKLTARQAQLEDELMGIKLKIEEYRPMVAAFRGFSDAINKYKENMKKEVSNERTLG